MKQGKIKQILVPKILGIIILLASFLLVAPAYGADTNTNLVLDGDMEAQDLGPWKMYRSPRLLEKVSVGNNQETHVVAPNVAGVWQRFKNLVPGNRYVFSGDYLLASGQMRAIMACGKDCVRPLHLDRKASTDVKHFELNFTAEKSTMTMYLFARKTRSAIGEVSFDNVSLVDIGPEPEPILEPEPKPTPTSLTDQDYANLTIVNLDPSAFPQDPGDTYKVEGRTYYVATNGDNNNEGSFEKPFQTIAEAEKHVQSGDMVLVRGGTYENCRDYYDCYELELNTPNVIWKNYQSEEVRIVPSSIMKSRVMQILGNNIVFDGFTVGNVQSTGIVLSWADNFSAAPQGQILKNLRIEVSNSGVTDGIGIYGHHNGLRLKNVEIIGAGSQGITCAGKCSNIRLENVKVIMNGVEVGSGADALGFEDADNVLITNLEAANATADGIDIKGTNVAVFNSYVHDIGRNGIKLWQGGDIVNTIVRDTGADASVVGEAGHYRILNSIIAHHNRKSGFTSYSMVFDYNNTGDVKFEFINSVICGNTGGVFLPNDANVKIEGSIYESKTSCSSLGLQDLPNGHFTFDSNSKFANGGVSVGYLPPFDFYGQARVKGRSVDIGAYELY